MYTTTLSLLQTSLKSEERDVAKGNSYSMQLISSAFRSTQMEEIGLSWLASPSSLPFWEGFHQCHREYVQG